MAKMKSRKNTGSQADILLREQMAAINQAKSDISSGVIDDKTYRARIAEVMATGEMLDKARQGRLALHAAEAARTTRGSGSRGQIVLAGNRTLSPELITQDRASEMLGGTIRTPAVRLSQVQTANPIAQSILAAQIAGEKAAAESAQKAAKQAAVTARVGAAIPKVEQAASKIRIPGYFGSTPATTNPAVADAVTRLRASSSPKMVATRGREALRVARSAAEGAKGKATAGKGLLLGGGAALLGLIASKAFGKNELDPQMQMMLAQRMGQAQDGGGDMSKGLVDLNRALTIVKKLQELSAVQGPAALRPRLI